MVSLEDEARLYEMLQASSKMFSNKSEVKTLKRKLEMRKQKRAKSLKVHLLDPKYVSMAGIKLPLRNNLTKNKDKNQKQKHVVSKEENCEKDAAATNGDQLCIKREECILDRFQVVVSSDNYTSMKGCSFRTRLLGRDYHQLQCIKSPHTGRMLKPFIHRDFKAEPLKLRLLREICSKAKKLSKSVSEDVEKRHPIDYMYVRPHHIPSINQLAREFIWPGIDLSECLQYPDFSCVAVYRKIVVGFAFLVPDVSYVEAYVSFIFTHPEWRRVGIAKFMLYHLIQTCMGKDITLHVSANNPAILLYQKFGFKVEEYITNFYDKYLPPDSKECKHALFLRLSR